MSDPNEELQKPPNTPAAAESAPPAEPEEELASGSVIGFILVPAMLVVVIVGIGWVFWYLTYNPYSVMDYARLLRSPSKSERWQAALDMVETNRASADLTPILIEIIHAGEEDKSVLDTVAWATSDILKTPEERKVNLRWYAVAALAKIGGPEAFSTLMEVLGDGDAGVRFYAVHGLGRIRNPKAAPKVIEILKGDADSAVRMTSAWALGEFGDPSAAPALLEAYQKDKEKDVRWNAAIALSRFCEESVRDTLNEMSKTDNAHTRDQARRAIRLLNECAKKQ